MQIILISGLFYSLSSGLIWVVTHGYYNKSILLCFSWGVFSGNGLLTQLCVTIRARVFFFFLRGIICSEFSQCLLLCFLLLWKSLLRQIDQMHFYSSIVQRTEKKKVFLESLLMNTHQIHISCLDVCSERASYNSVPLHLTSVSAFHWQHFRYPIILKEQLWSFEIVTHCSGPEQLEFSGFSLNKQWWWVICRFMF